jgi:hypothetical protein
VRDSGCQHLQEVILQLQLLILDEVGDALDHDHVVGDVLEQDLLLLEGDDFLCLLWIVCLGSIANVRFLVCHFIFHNAEIESLRGDRGFHNAQFFFSVIANLADIEFGTHVIWVAAIVIDFDSGLSNHFSNGF